MKLWRVREKERKRRRRAADLASDHSYAEIRARTGMSYATITKALREAGIAGRKALHKQSERPEDVLDRADALAELEPEGEGWIAAKLRELRG